MTFPRLQPYTDDPVPLEIAKRRVAFAQGPLAQRAAPEAPAATCTPEEWGTGIFKTYGSKWPEAIARASAAAMAAERAALALREGMK